MIVPDHWAEARLQHRAGRRRITVRRFGWSQVDVADAQAMADRRAAEALARLLAGDVGVERRERRLAYNGADGLPIREEVLARHGEAVITRNAYGARCLNTPHALFADVDFAPRLSRRAVLACWLLLALSGLAAGLWLRSAGTAIAAVIAALPLGPMLASLLTRAGTALAGGPERLARHRAARFVARHPDWNLRLYRTPAGLRLLATHRGFDAREAEVAAFFDAVGADPVYRRMCMHQRCFRARLTAKPWRAGIATHLRPRPGVWPVAAGFMVGRAEWVARYEWAAAGFAACRFVSEIGSGRVDEGLRAVIELHDRETRALETDLALA
ncbi:MULTISPECIES: hypothetical protein [Derxia]|uniref:Transmembrane protein n=1 Tax=Derxia gummosa DSM 723 TaxID=1121388 RepID=A0A8B6X372_9BURK|nr:MULTISPECIES: hypothetical protein [Derxia]